MFNIDSNKFVSFHESDLSCQAVVSKHGNFHVQNPVLKILPPSGCQCKDIDLCYLRSLSGKGL